MNATGMQQRCNLILKRASASRPSGQWQDEDYDVLADGKVIGRIYEDASASTPPELRWLWSVTAILSYPTIMWQMLSTQSGGRVGSVQ
jgi:hypothetical protein